MVLTSVLGHLGKERIWKIPLRLRIERLRLILTLVRTAIVARTTWFYVGPGLNSNLDDAPIPFFADFKACARDRCSILGGNAA